METPWPPRLPVAVKDSLPGCGILPTPAGETLLDMGRNCTGCLDCAADDPAGTPQNVQE